MFRATRSKKILAILLLLSLALGPTVYWPATAEALSFTDLSDHWARDSIARLAGLQVVSGYKGRFNPHEQVTRSEFTAMLVKALGLADQAQIVQGSPTGYKDLAPGYWAAGFVLVAGEIGAVSGYPDGSFRPSAVIRRDEITSVLVRALDLRPEDDMPDPAGIFRDGQGIPGWARDAVKIAYHYKLVAGFPDGNFYPDRPATRGETAVLIEKVLQQLGAEFTFAGQVQNINESARSLTLDIHGQIETFAYRPGVEVRSEGAPVKIGELKTGSRVLVILDDDGCISFIQTAGGTAPETGAQIFAGNAGANEAAVADTAAFNATVAGVSTAGSAGPGGQTGGSIIMTGPGQAARVAALIESRGGRVKLASPDVNLVVAELPGSLIGFLKASPLVEEITPDRRIKVNGLSGQQTDPPVSEDETNPGRSLNVSKEAIKAPEFVNLTRSDGKGQVIAIIDTGVDAGHPDLQKTSGNKPKIVDWRDFTKEGDIDTSSLVEPAGRTLPLANGSYYIGDIVSAGRKFRYGYLREMDLKQANGNTGLDLNFNGKETDVFAVIVADRAKSGIYDTVYLDLDGDHDFADEKPLHLFAESFEYLSFTGDNGRSQFNFVLTEIDLNGTRINLGFDGNDHGTHIAGIAAANGKIKGVATGAQIMAIKALDTAGYGSIGTITAAMTYAATHGAKIINLSFGFPGSDHNGASIPAKLLNNLTEQYGVIFVAAAGNDGPGLSTVATPGDATAALSVGAFNSPEMWKMNYGWQVPNENLWFFSSAGPRTDGAVSPSIVAPGSAISTVPLRDGRRYFLSEGTSMAAPHVAGALALLMEVVRRNNLKVSPLLIKRAIEAGARIIPGYTVAEQGYGALNLTMSWTELLSLQNIPQIDVRTSNPDNTQGVGIFFRESIPGKLTLFLRNNSTQFRKVKLAGGTWLSPAQETVNLPAEKTRAVDVKVNIPDRKGLFSAILSGDDALTYGRVLEVLATVVNPYELNQSNNYTFNLNDWEDAAQYKRYYFKVPAASGAIKAELTVPDGWGRTKIFLFDPKGRLAGETDFAGVNPGGTTTTVKAAHNYPAAGVWEVVVYSSAGLSAYNLNKSSYSLSVGLEGVTTGELQPKNRDLTVGVVPKVLRAGDKDWITVQVRDRYTKKPFTGFIEIDGRIYYTHRGRVTLPVDAPDGQFSLMVKTVPGSPAFRPWQINFTLPSA